MTCKPSTPKQTQPFFTFVCCFAHLALFSALAARGQTCDLYPIGLSAQSLSNAVPGAVVDVFNGTQPGNFGWLSWGGSPSEPTLVASLKAPGNVSTYVNPDDPADYQVSIGDWISSKPGVSNSRKMREALDALTNLDITIPVWSETRGQGEKTAYRVSAFAQVRLLSYQLPGQNQISARFLGFTACGVVNLAPVVSAGADQTITLPAAAVLEGQVSDDGLPAGNLSVSWLLVSGAGSVTFTNASTPATLARFDSPGTYVLTLTASDGALTNSDEVIITVKRENHAPTAVTQTTTNLEDQAQLILLAGDDPDGDALAYVVVTEPVFGQLTGTAPNLIYTPKPDYNGLDSFAVKAFDGLLESDVVTNFIVILPVNDPPVADAQSLTTAEDTTLALVLSGSDVEGGPLTFTILCQPTNGVLATIAGGTNQYTYAPFTNFYGDDGFVFIANDGELDSTPAVISIHVTPVNDPPDVEAGGDQIVSLPVDWVALSGQVADDNFSGLGDIQTLWDKVSGPGEVTFACATNIVTTATFSSAGVYVLRLTAADGFFASTDELVITVNAPPLVEAGPDLTNTFPASLALAGAASDDQLPTNAVLSTRWSKATGPGTVIFHDPTATNTTAAFSEGGTYLLRLTADDGLATTTDELQVVVNLAPIVDAGSDQTNSTPQAVLEGTVADDGLPRGIMVMWTKVSGPGEVFFEPATNLSTTVSFSQSGIYVLRLNASDSLAESSDDLTIMVNSAPTASAGPDLRVTVGEEVILPGVVTDDGLPPDTSLTVVWTQVGGIGLMEFGQPAHAETTARFNETGLYILRLTASDSLTSAFDEVAVTVLPINRAPSVVAGPKQLVLQPSLAQLSGTVTDDGLPENAVLNVVWSKISGPGTVTFTNPSGTNTGAAFSEVGDYVLRLTASDTALTSFADVPIAVRTPAMNQVPVVNAGTDLVVGLTNSATLAGSIADDGLPQGAALTARWSVVSGPGSVTFENSTITNARAAFSALGTYVLRLTASDSQLSASDDISVTVYPYNQPPIVEAGPDQTVVLPDPELLYPNPFGITNVNTYLSRSLLSVAHWNNSLGQPGITGTPYGSYLSVGRNCLAVENGQLLVAGGFTNAGGTWAKGLARYDGTNWHNFYDTNELPNACGHSSGCSGGIVGWLVPDCNTVYCSEIFDCVAGRKQEVFAGGLFKDLGNLDGWADPAARWDGTRWHSWAFKQSGSTDIRVINTQPDKVYLGGNFAFQATNATSETITALPWSYCVATWDGTNWGSLGSGITDVRDTPHPSVPGLNIYNAYVSSLAVWTNGDVYVAGQFIMPTAWGYASNVAKWNGLAWQPLSTGLKDNVGLVTGMALADNGDLYVGGSFTNAGGYAVRNVARWDGTRWWPLGEGPANGVNGTVEAIAIHGRDVYVSGSFSEAGGLSASHIAKWDGQFWSPLGSGITNGIQGSVYSLAVDDTGVYVGGMFTTAGGLPANNLAKWESTVPPLQEVVLNGLVTDDGLPAGGTLTRQWTKVSGPGEVKCADPFSAVTTAVFSKAGTYVLRLTADDSELTGLDEVTVTIRANQPPVANAGPDQVIGLDEPLALNGFVADDGLPEGAPVHHVWQQIYGPGTVTFDNPAGTNVTARFPQQGTYVLRLAANDSQFTTFDEITVIVSPRNQPPTVYPGSSVTITFGNSHTLNATVTDDGSPTNGRLSVAWSVFSGPGQVTFNDANLIQPTVSFSTNGNYVLRLTATDSELTTTGHVTITVSLPVNNAPVVDAGPNQTISNLFTRLQGTASDDGNPLASALEVYWSRVGTGGIVTFANSNSPTTAVTFSQSGIYTLALSAKDGTYTVSDSVTITIPNQPPLIVEAGPDRTITLPTNSLQLAGYVKDITPNNLSWSPLPGGPGTATFTGATTLTPTVTFSTAGTNLIRFRVSHGNISYDDELTVVVAPQGNAAPWVDAGPDQILLLPTSSVTLGGSISDDGLPAGNRVTSFWTQVTGPAQVTLSDPASLTPELSFEAVGTYLFRLIATDGSLTNGDDVVISVQPFANLPPQVAAGADITTRVTNILTLAGLVTDDAHPTNALLSASWREVSGPGLVTFDSPNVSAASTSSLPVPTTVAFSVPGTYLLRLVADDSEYAASDDLTVTVLGTDDNQAPVVNAGLDAGTVTYSPFILSGSVADDGLPLGAAVSTLWSVVSAPARVYFSDACALTPYAQFAAPGTYVLRLAANDTHLSAYDDLVVTVSAPTNHPPSVFAGLPIEVTRPDPALLQGVVLDDGLPIGHPVTATWSQAGGPGTVTFVPNANDPLALAYFSTAGQYTLRLEADDSEYVVMDEVTVNVLPGTNAPPSVNAGPDFAAALSDPAILTTEVSDDGLENGTLEISWSALNGPGPVYFSTVNGVYRATFAAPGDYVLRLTAHDGSLTNSDDVAVAVYDAPPPIAELAAPLDGAIITAPSNIIGTASSPILQSYVLEYRAVPPSATLNLPPSESVDWTMLVSNTVSIHTNVLGTLDPTLALNGTYELRLTATDLVGRAATTDPVTVIFDGNLKIGHFTLSFSDLKVPVAGVPIEIVRTYDSRNRQAGDFGVGWTLDIRNVRVQKNRPLAYNWQSEGGPATGYNYSLDPFRPRLVTLIFPDGKTHEFEARSDPEFQWAYPITAATIVYRPQGDTRGSLISLSPDADDVLLDGYSGTVNLFDYHGDLYEPTRFQFTSDEGEVYVIDQREGLQSLSDRNGNTLLISTNGVVWTNLVTGGPSLGITFVRDEQRRISRIIDPQGNALNYAYGTNGSLAAFTDRETNTTAFAYTNTAFPHYLTEITDPRGLKAIRTEFDASGRMIRHIDAEGNTVEFTHDLANNREMIYDRLGNLTIHEYDGRGNVVRTTDPLGNVTCSKYDALDNELEKVDALGNTNRFTYDDRGNKLTETDPLGNTTRYTYGQFRELTSVTNPRGFTTTNSYDEAGNLLEQRDPLGYVTSYTYDARGNVLTRTDALGNVLTNAYDSLGRTIFTATLNSQFEPLSQTTFTYDTNGNQLTKTVKRTVNRIGVPPAIEFLTTTYSYDKENRLIQTIHPDGSSNQTVYVPGLDKPAAEIDPLRRQTLHYYDERGNETNTVYADLTSESFFYDAENRRIGLTDRAGRLTTYAFDPLGRLTNAVFPDGATTNLVYDALGRIVATQGPRGNNTWFAYDPNCGCSGRQAYITNALGHVTHRAYDENGNESSVTDALGRTTTYAYDANDRRTYIVYPDGTVTVTTYDSLGRRIAETDQNTNTTWFVYDALGRLLAVTNALGKVTLYAYDEAGSLIAQTDANNHTTTYAYDAMGRRTSRTLPLGQVETYQYDLAGNLTNKVDFNGRSTRYAYDPLNRLLSKTPDAVLGAPTVTFAYDALGQRTNMVDASGSTQYRYDMRARLVQKLKTWTAVGLSVALNYAYDACGNVTSIASSSPNGVALTYTYDALNRLETATDAHTGTTTYNYDSVGNLAGYAYPNGLSSTYEYDALNRLTNLVTSKSSLVTASYRYTVAPSGHRLSAAENVFTTSGVQTINRLYTYDATYRLTGESLTTTGLVGLPTSADIGYTLDDVGNRLTRTSTVPGVEAAGYAYDANDRLTNDTYDANGNTLLSTGFDQTQADQYDFENRLLARHTAIHTIGLSYDGDGNRTGKTVDAITTLCLVDDRNPTGYPQVLEELTVVAGSTAVIRVYAYGSDLISQDQLLDTGNGEFAWFASFYGYDGHGNVRYLTSANRGVTDTYDYDAFGTLIAQIGPTPNSYLYCGEQFGPDLNMYYSRARYLNAGSGRFWTPDLIDGSRHDPATLHKYLYAASDPVNRDDPSGLLFNGSLTELQFTTALRNLITKGGQANFRLVFKRTGCVVVTQIVQAGVDYGVYLFADAFTGGTLPYVGKAVNIDRRISDHAARVARQIARFMPHGAPLAEAEQFIINAVRAAVGTTSNIYNAVGVDARDFVKNAFRFCN